MKALRVALVISITMHIATAQTLHISDMQLETRAGYFRNGLYWGGIPQTSKQEEFYQCTTTCDSTSCGTFSPANNTFCLRWNTYEDGADQTANGDCWCTSISANNMYCGGYYCQQTVEQETSCGGSSDDDSCYSTFTKYKDCHCVDGSSNGTYCSKWNCLGYGDGPLKIDDWQCTAPASIEILGVTSDFCWYFISDQYSDAVEEVKDCNCIESTSTYCTQWHCIDRISKKWHWWTPIVGSCVGAALNLWVPIAIKCGEDTTLTIVLLCWTLLTYLEIVLVGGVVSTVANSGALILAFLIVFRPFPSCKCRSLTRKAAYPDALPPNHPTHDVVNGEVLQTTNSDICAV